MTDGSEPMVEEVFISVVQPAEQGKSAESSLPTRMPSALSIFALSSAMATAKNFLFPANPADLPSGSQIQKLPPWFAKDFVREAVLHTKARGIIKDTVLLSAGTVIWHSSLRLLASLRQADDVVNKGVAGFMTGSFLTAAMNARQGAIVGRSIVGGAVGTLVGFCLFHAEMGMEARLLQSQQKLERELLGVPEDELHQRFKPELYQKLVHMKQQALVNAHPPASNLKKLLDKAKDKGLDQNEWQDLMKSAPWIAQDSPTGSNVASGQHDSGHTQ